MTDLHLRNSDPCDPRKLTIDCIERKEGESRREAHRGDNIQCLCYMCNQLKNDMPNADFLRLIAYLKGECDLDLSDAPFQRINTVIGEAGRHSFQNTLRFHDPTIKDPWLHVSKLYQDQSGVDELFGKFPLIFITRGSKFACSVDQIVSGDHTQGFQLLPVFMNFAKATLTNAQVRDEFHARGWFLPTHATNVILPKDYHEHSYILANMGVIGLKRRRLALNGKGLKRSAEFGEKISQSKKGKANINGRRRMLLVAIPLPPLHGPPLRFDYYCDAVNYFGLQSRAASNISSCVLGKLKSAYGHKWEDWGV